MGRSVGKRGILAVQALQSLVSILRSLVDWYLQSLEREGAGDMVESTGPLAGVDESVRRNWDYLTSKPSSDQVEESEAADDLGTAINLPCAFVHGSLFSFSSSFPFLLCMDGMLPLSFVNEPILQLKAVIFLLRAVTVLKPSSFLSHFYLHFLA